MLFYEPQRVLQTVVPSTQRKAESGERIPQHRTGLAKDESHIIQKQVFDLEIDRKDRAQAIQSEVSRVFHETLKEKIQAVIEELAPAEQDIQLHQLELDLGEIDESQLATELLIRVPKALRRALSAQLTELSLNSKRKPWIGEAKTKHKSRLQQAVFLLERGYAHPAQSQEADSPEGSLRALLQHSPDQLLTAIRRSPHTAVMVRRLFRSLRPGERKKLFAQATGYKTRSEKLYRRVIANAREIEQQLRKRPAPLPFPSVREQLEQLSFTLLLQSPRLAAHPDMVQLTVQEAENQFWETVPFEADSPRSSEKKESVPPFSQPNQSPKALPADSKAPLYFPREQASPYARPGTTSAKQREDSVEVAALLDYLQYLFRYDRLPWWAGEVSPRGHNQAIQTLLTQYPQAVKVYFQTEMAPFSALGSPARNWLTRLLKWVSPEQRIALLGILEKDFLGFIQTLKLFVIGLLTVQQRGTASSRAELAERWIWRYLLQKQGQPYQPTTALTSALRQLLATQTGSFAVLTQLAFAWVQEQVEGGQKRFEVLRHLLPQVAREWEVGREEGRVESEKGGTGSEEGRVRSEKGGTGSEKGGVESEEGRVESEKGEVESEEGGAGSEKGGTGSEEGGVGSEEGRVESEKGRVGSEKGGTGSEELGGESEKGGTGSEEGRVRSEKGGLENEKGRVRSEKGEARSEEEGTEIPWAAWERIVAADREAQGKADTTVDSPSAETEVEVGPKELLVLLQSGKAWPERERKSFLAALIRYLRQGSFAAPWSVLPLRFWQTALLQLSQQHPAIVRPFIRDHFSFQGRKRMARLFNRENFVEIVALFSPPRTVIQRFQRLLKWTEKGPQSQTTPDLLREHLLYFLLHPGTQKNQHRYLENLLRYEARSRRQELLTVVIEWQTRAENTAGNSSAESSLNKSLEALRQTTELLPPKAKRPRSQQEQPQFRRNKEEPIYIKNAGVVLIWPFLSFYFKQLALVGADRDFKDEASRFRAALLLQYLGTGKTESAEQELVLNKIMCGIEIETPIPVSLHLSEDERLLSEKLFDAVRQQWPTVKTSSDIGIRGSFLVREGRLLQKGENWYLRVEQRGFDMLLDRLPWAINLVRYQWMPNLLHVEWR